MHRRQVLAALAALVPLAAACATPTPDIVGLPRDIKGPILSFPEGNMFFYVENDGQHVVALNEEGKIVWRREPFVEYPAEGEVPSPIKSLRTPGYDPGSGRRVLMVSNATSFRGLDMVTGDYLLG